MLRSFGSPRSGIGIDLASKVKHTFYRDDSGKKVWGHPIKYYISGRVRFERLSHLGELGALGKYYALTGYAGTFLERHQLGGIYSIVPAESQDPGHGVCRDCRRS